MTKVYDNATDLITFARNSTGTALRRVGYGPELVADFSTYADTAAMKAAGWSSATSTGTGDISLVTGAMQLDSNGTSNRARGAFAISTSVGRSYVVEYLATGRANANHHFRVGSVENGSQNFQALNAPAGTHAETFVATSTTTYVTWEGFTAAGDETQIANISVREVIFDRATDDLILFNHPDDIPRIEYGSDGSLKGLLIEEQRTNLVTHSEDFANDEWEKVGTVAIDSTLVTGPDGTLSGRRVLNLDDAAGDRLVGPVSITDATLTSSIWVKGEGDNIGKDIQLTAKRSGGTFAGSSVSHTLTADWVRIHATFTQDPTNTGARIVLVNPNNGNEASEVLIYGAQIEAGSFPTSYIPTSGSQKTRWPDIASIPVSAFGYNQSAGTVVVEFDTVGGADIGDDHYVLSGDHSNARWAYHNTADVLKIYDGAQAPGIILNQDDLPVKHKFAVASDASSVSTASGGSITASNTTSTGNLPALTTAFILGSSHLDASHLNGHIKSLQYYPRRLTDAQLQELTA